MISAALRSARRFQVASRALNGSILTKTSAVNAGKAFSTNVDSFLAASSSVYVEQMYTAWKKDPARYAWFYVAIFRFMNESVRHDTSILPTAQVSDFHAYLPIPPLLSPSHMSIYPRFCACPL